MLAQPAADADRFDTAGQARAVVGLDEDAADGRRTEGRLVTALAYLGGEPAQRLFLLVADDAVVVGAGPGVGLVAGAAGQDLAVGGRDVGVGAHHQRGAAVAVVAHGHLLAGGLAVHVDHHGDGHLGQRRLVQLAVGGGKCSNINMADGIGGSAPTEASLLVVGGTFTAGVVTLSDRVNAQLKPYSDFTTILKLVSMPDKSSLTSDSGVDTDPISPIISDSIFLSTASGDWVVLQGIPISTT